MNMTIDEFKKETYYDHIKNLSVGDKIKIGEYNFIVETVDDIDPLRQIILSHQDQNDTEFDSYIVIGVFSDKYVIGESNIAEFDPCDIDYLDT